MTTLSKWTDDYIRQTNRKGLALLSMRADALAALSVKDAEIKDLQAELEEQKGNYLRACQTVAAMHAAATGDPGSGPRRGVVEDIEDLRAWAIRAYKAMLVYPAPPMLEVIADAPATIVTDAPG